LIQSQNIILILQVIFDRFLKIVSCDMRLILTEHLTYDEPQILVVRPSRDSRTTGVCNVLGVFQS